MRREESMTSDVMTELAAGTIVECRQRVECEGRARVRIRQGWISEKQMEVIDEEFTTSEKVRIWVLSDLHTDNPGNLRWLSFHISKSENVDILMCAGDISHRHDVFTSTMKILSENFDLIVFTPGNHDLWGNSLEKLDEIRRTVRCTPLTVNDLRLIPLFSWYEASFDQEPDTIDMSAFWLDYTRCKWGDLELAEGFDPKDGRHLARYFASLNSNPSLKPTVITMSHYAPRFELIPEKRFLTFPHLPKVAGSSVILDQITPFKPAVHIFGHTHLAMDYELDGIRYVNWPLGNEKEHKHTTRVVAGSGALLLWSSDVGFSPVQWTFWSHYYRTHKRTNSTVLAPWVHQHLSRLGFPLPPPQHSELPTFPDNMPADDFYRLNAKRERKFRSSSRGDDVN